MDTPKKSIFARPIVQTITGTIVIILVVVGALVYKVLSSRVRIETSSVEAPIIAIGPQGAGILGAVYVQEGDHVTAGEALAQVGSEVLNAKVAGIVVSVSNTPGQVFAPGQTVVAMIDPTALRVVGTIKENEGLDRIAVGDPVTFTVDAFKGHTYTGIVDSISPTADETGVAFSISDERPTKEYDAKVRYDYAAHPEFRNGMSAKMNVYRTRS
ncbi:MAG TPA: HlyD family efflux transporter periplasmic adaptor subunit [Candidatus Paceibacterota bacterium]|nr:HlyD family efflux transporter periplasmic adaptor subunit [Candidatus Paceibacterota bacterium]